MSPLLTTHYKLLTKKGASLVDVLVGIAFIVTAFTALFGTLELAVRLIAHTKARIGAVALAGEQTEYIRSLPYGAVGTAGGIPAGSLPQTETIALNGISYTRRTLIQYVDAPEDGEGVDDENGITADYKRAKVELAWKVRGDDRSFFTLTNIVPKGIETIAGGGTLLIEVINSSALPVGNASVRIENNALSPAVSITTSTNTAGRVIFPGSPAAGSYEITVTKPGYGTAQTYTADPVGNPNPNPGHLTVVAGETTSMTFTIDLLASKTVRSFEPVREEEWSDEFDNQLKIFMTASTTVLGGEITLRDISGAGEEYEADGYVISHSIEPSYLLGWKELVWDDTTPPATDIVYRLHYIYNLASLPVPEADFPGNALGFNASPVNLAGLSTTTYPSIQIAGNFSTADASTTPTLRAWSVAYDRGPVPLGNLAFSLRGDKFIGTDGGGVPIYKYTQNLSTGSGGVLMLPSLEPDTYTITVGSGTGFDVAESCTPQPRAIAPSSAVTTDMILVPNTLHSLKVAVVDGAGTLLPGASVRLSRAGFDNTKTTSACGQVFWGGLGEGKVANGNAYTLDVTLSGYQPSHTVDVEVSQVSERAVLLVP